MSNVDQVYVDRLMHMLCAMGIQSAKAADFDEDLRRLVHVTFRPDAANVHYLDDDDIVNYSAWNDARDLAACGCPVEYIADYDGANLDQSVRSRTVQRCCGNLFRLLAVLGVHKQEQYRDIFGHDFCGAW